MSKKEMHSRVKKLRFSSIVREFREEFSKLHDFRVRRDYAIEDIVMSVFAMMFFQDPSLLHFQNRLRKGNVLNNVKNIFGIENVASDGTIRNVLDKVDSSKLQGLFFNIFRHLQNSGKLKEFLNLDKYYYIALDGTQYFSSYKCNCDKCIRTQKKGQPTRYSHSVIQATLVDPEQKFIIPLISEEIVNSDIDENKGYNKQDSEQKAAKRLLKKLRENLPNLNIIILGDDLYSREPMIKLLKELNMSFILTAKRGSHKELYSFLDSENKIIERMTTKNTVNISKKKRLEQLKKLGKSKKDLKEPEIRKRYYKQTRISEYKYYNGNIPINSNYKTFVNYFELRTYDKLTEETLFYNSWVTDLDINNDNIKKLVKAGRGRWNIENRQFLTTKKGGYNLEHNFGPGKENLSFNFYILNVLAFLVHQVLHIVSNDFNRLYENEGTFSAMYTTMKTVLRLLTFKSFDELIFTCIGDNST
jgi:hypothetical protein